MWYNFPCKAALLFFSIHVHEVDTIILLNDCGCQHTQKQSQLLFDFIQIKEIDKN